MSMHILTVAKCTRVVFSHTVLLLSSLRFGCMQEFAVKVLFVFFLFNCVFVRLLSVVSDALISFLWMIPLFLSLPVSICLYFRFGARSTGSRREEKRLIFQYVILYFFENKCVFPYSLVCVFLNTQVLQTYKKKELNHHSNANDSWPQSDIAHLWDPY